MKKIFNNRKFLLFLIILIAGLLRFIKLDSIPPSLYWDEVSQGYNAYSILKTGKDEHQETFPIARFIAFGDYKAPVYTYLIVPFMAVLGKTELAVRLPSAFFGTLTVLATFFLVKEILYKEKNAYSLALISAFLLAISPWHIQLSRVAYEANIATFFTVCAVWIFFKSIRKNISLLPLSAVLFVLAFYSFNAHRIFIPLLVLFLSILNYQALFKNKKAAIFSLIIGLALLIPYMRFFQSPESKLRFNEVNIFSDISIIEKSNRWMEANNNSFISKILSNRRILYAQSYITHYFDFYNPTYLFIQGDSNPRFSSRDVGQLYLWQAPFIAIGVYLLFFFKRKIVVFLIIWLLLAPVAAATARETPHALRSETFIPLFELFTSIGIVGIYQLLKNYHIIKRMYVIMLASIMLGYFIVFIYGYFTYFPIEFSGEWQYGYKQAILETERLKNQYDIIAMTKSYGRPYIYVLFYSDINPAEYWKISKVRRDSYGFYEVDQVGKYQFREKLVLPQDAGQKVLYVGKTSELPQMTAPLKQIPFLKGDGAFVIGEL